MRTALQSFCSIIPLIASVFAFPSGHDTHLAVRTSPPTPLPLEINVVYQFPQATWVENLAVRSNSGGDIICSIFTSPDLYLVDPSSGEATLLHSFPTLGVLGIAQLGHDIFYIATGNLSLATRENTPGSYSIYEVDIRGYDKHGLDGVTVTELVHIPESGQLNGIARLSSSSNILLVADATNGYVWEVDAKTGAYTYVSVPEMLPTPGEGVNLGVNGVKSKDGYLYWSNSAYGTLSRIAIDESSGEISGAVEVLASGIAPDDFVIGRGGYIWICQNSLNKLSVLAPNGTLVDVAGSPDSLLVPGPTACEFGWDQKLYCTTTGGLQSPVNGTTVGGEIIEIDAEGFKL